MGSAIGSIIGGETVYGLYLLGGGIIVMGIGIILCPIFFNCGGVACISISGSGLRLRRRRGRSIIVLLPSELSVPARISRILPSFA